MSVLIKTNVGQQQSAKILRRVECYNSAENISWKLKAQSSQLNMHLSNQTIDSDLLAIW